MAYLMLETSVRTHPKFLAAGPEACWLWVCGLGYCQDGLTDGFIPATAIEYLGVKAPRRLAAILVKVGLWDAADGGWRMHDYLEHNKPAVEVREIMRLRKEGGRLGGRPRKNLGGFPDDARPDNLEGKPPAKPPSESEGNLPENPLLPVQPERPVRPSETPIALARGFGGGAGAGTNPRDHLNCRQPCERVCLSEKQHGILRERHGGTDADLDAFYRDVRSRLDPGVPIGDKPWQFWEMQFAARFGSAGSVNPRTAGNAAARERFISRGQA